MFLTYLKLSLLNKNYKKLYRLRRLAISLELGFKLQAIPERGCFQSREYGMQGLPSINISL